MSSSSVACRGPYPWPYDTVAVRAGADWIEADLDAVVTDFPDLAAGARDGLRS
ncbi:hypothetical protein ABZ802_02585 [Streptomyces sp. NPDC047737]|uniref:hypothetical protein n=1 Tax=unclassified Streptomyces TaxID=2593676 RepID=UPI00340C6535